MTLTDMTGVIHSPNYPNIYPPDTYCRYVIKAPTSTGKMYRVSLEFDHLSTVWLSYKLNNKDWVEVYDGELPVRGNRAKSSPSNLLARLMDDRSHETAALIGHYVNYDSSDRQPHYKLTSTGGSMTVVFRSDAQREDIGFNASYTITGK